MLLMQRNCHTYFAMYQTLQAEQNYEKSAKNRCLAKRVKEYAVNSHARTYPINNSWYLMNICIYLYIYNYNIYRTRVWRCRFEYKLNHCQLCVFCVCWRKNKSIGVDNFRFHLYILEQLKFQTQSFFVQLLAKKDVQHFQCSFWFNSLNKKSKYYDNTRKS